MPNAWQEKLPLLTKLVKRRLPEILLVGGVFFMLLQSLHLAWRDTALSLQAELAAQYQEPVATASARPAKPMHISVGEMVNVGVEPGVFQDNKWTVSEAKATYLEQSARPGEQGNIILYGHNKREILGNIRAMKGREKIRLMTEDGKEHWYQVESWHEVSPEQVEWLEPTQKEVLTIYTCSGFLDKQRYIIRAVPIENPSQS